jgi:hypothetical protein
MNTPSRRFRVITALSIAVGFGCPIRVIVADVVRAWRG